VPKEGVVRTTTRLVADFKGGEEAGVVLTLPLEVVEAAAEAAAEVIVIKAATKIETTTAGEEAEVEAGMEGAETMMEAAEVVSTNRIVLAVMMYR
jgi:hypothetical protein